MLSVSTTIADLNILEFWMALYISPNSSMEVSVLPLFLEDLIHYTVEQFEIEKPCPFTASTSNAHGFPPFGVHPTAKPMQTINMLMIAD